jgi:hypothetical protein
MELNHRPADFQDVRKPASSNPRSPKKKRQPTYRRVDGLNHILSITLVASRLPQNAAPLELCSSIEELVDPDKTFDFGFGAPCVQAYR